MQIFDKVSDIHAHIAGLKAEGKTIGFVPTMGALHRGHLALVERAARENDIAVASIFVNPTQFNNKNDLAKYPRHPEDDIAKLRQTNCSIVFLPTESEMYPDKVESENIDLNGLDSTMEGAHRPGHFDGVATIVGRFFNILSPTRAYFGEKDFQQLQIIRHLSKYKNYPTEVVAHPIERSEEGLALSSRNQLLSEEEKEKALIIWQSLKWARENYSNHDPQSAEAYIEECFKDSGLDLEYVQFVDENRLQPVKNWSDSPHVRAFIAAYISGVRLIDNLLLF